MYIYINIYKYIHKIFILYINIYIKYLYYIFILYIMLKTLIVNDPKEHHINTVN
jgi:hypothetical protein